jgi:hypothetical protein
MYVSTEQQGILYKPNFTIQTKSAHKILFVENKRSSKYVLSIDCKWHRSTVSLQKVHCLVKVCVEYKKLCYCMLTSLNFWSPSYSLFFQNAVPSMSSAQMQEVNVSYQEIITHCDLLG